MKTQHGRNCRRLSLLIAMALLVIAIASTGLVAHADADPAATPSVDITYKNLSYSDSTYMLFAVGYENFNPN